MGACQGKKTIKYYKKYYNTSGGKATIDEYITNYNNFVGIKK